jgi:hypothetical protein
MARLGLTLLLLCQGLFYPAAASPRVPDVSAECLACEALTTKLFDTWTDEDTVADKLASLEAKCADLPSSSQSTCDKIVDALVQIPPALFDGMLDLAWPIAPATCGLIRQCEMPCCSPLNIPEQIHLSAAATDRSLMGVTWVTLEGDASSSVVEYGLAPHRLSSTTSASDGSVDTYHSAGWIGVIHRATLTGLLPNTQYYYRVGDPSHPLRWSSVKTFTTLATDPESVTFAVVADMAYDSNSDGTIASIQRLVEDNKVHAVIHSGDISYADGFENHFDDFFNKVEPIASRVPYMVSPGNHEFWFNFSSYKKRFTMPGVLNQPNDAGVSGGSGDNMYYSWEYGPAHFTSMNSETAIDVGHFSDDCLAWADKDMAAVDRSTTPWLITAYHRPTYCSVKHGCNADEAGRLRFQTEKIFHENQVDLSLQGHVHSYERTLPVFHQKVGPLAQKLFHGTTYILQGSSGNREGNEGEYPDDNDPSLPDWSAARHVEVGYGLLTVSKSELKWEFFKAGTDELLDSVVMEK